jgi:fumarylacetoacetate (FAA) hydrolase
MKFVSFLNSEGEERVGLRLGEDTLDLSAAGKEIGVALPSTMAELLRAGPDRMRQAALLEKAFRDEVLEAVPPREIRPLSPVPHPTSVRDAYAFRQHVATARLNRGQEMIPEFDRFPVFYFANHLAIVGEGDVEVEKDHLAQLDFELEVAAVIGRRGKNIAAKDADGYIAGFAVMNDLSARQLQMEEMKLNLGPAKGKDFATALGPWLVTPDELEPKRTRGEQGSRWSLAMRAWHNGRLVSEGNLAEMHWSFGEIIERASYGVELHPGDVLGSGTVGTGCFLELNGTGARQAKAEGKAFTPTWLGIGDVVELEVEGLGKLRTRIARAPGDRTILSRPGR